METRHFDCRCSHFDHLMRVTLDAYDGDIWFELRMNHFLPWWKRVLVALAYVFKRPHRGEHFDTVELQHADIWRVQKLLNDAEELQSQKAARGTQSRHEKPVLKG
jgi:hypothetical protein